jgi:hypothetical protein
MVSYPFDSESYLDPLFGTARVLIKSPGSGWAAPFPVSRTCPLAPGIRLGIVIEQLTWLYLQHRA